MKSRAFTRLERIASLVSVIVALGCGSEDPKKPAQPSAAGAGGDDGGDSGSGGTGRGGKGGSGGSAGDDGGSSGAGAAGEGGAPAVPLSGALLPWATGNSWTYVVTEDATVSLKTTTVGDFGPIGGDGPYAETSAFHVVTAKGANMMDRTESWQARDENNPERVLRYREQAFSAVTGDLQLEEYWDPPKIHIDGNPELIFEGSSWMETYEETKLEVGRTPVTHSVTDVWIVLSDDATVSVPAGEFEHAIHLRKTGNGGLNVKEYWYLRGVGKLKEVGGQTEELSEYTIMPEDQP